MNNLLTEITNIYFGNIAIFMPIILVILLFVPGYLLLSLLQIRSDFFKRIVYIVGLSVSFLMFTGFLLNLILPYIGIAKPLSAEYLITSISVFIAILGTILAIRDRKKLFSFSGQKLINSSLLGVIPV